MDTEKEIQTKLQIADLTIELGQLLRDKTHVLEMIRSLGDREQKLLKEIAEKTEEFSKV